MRAALENVYEIKKLQPSINVVLIIGDMLELGKNTKSFHVKLIDIIELIKLLPLAIAAQLAGKRPPFLSHSIKNKDKLKNIFNKLEKK